MAINKIGALTFPLCALTWVLISASAWSREAASVSDCQSAAVKPSIANAKAAADHAPGDLAANFKLADAWSDAGCFSDAVQVLQSAQARMAQTQNPRSQELETRLRVARSLVGEEHYFDNLDRADADAKLKRDTFRCNTLNDLEACSEAVRLRPEDPLLLTAQGDALMHAKRPADAITHYRRAAALAPNPELMAKLSAAEAQTPASRAGGAAAEGAAAIASGRVGTVAAHTAKSQKPIRMARAEPASAAAPTVVMAASPAGLAAAPGAVRHFSNAPKDERSH